MSLKSRGQLKYLIIGLLVIMALLIGVLYAIGSTYADESNEMLPDDALPDPAEASPAEDEIDMAEFVLEIEPSSLGIQPFGATVPFEFLKITHTGLPMAGVTFHLYRYTVGAPNDGWGSPIHTVTTGPTGVVGPWNLTEDGSYRLVEVSAPLPHQTPPGHWTLSVNSHGNVVIGNWGGNPGFGGGGAGLFLMNQRYPEAPELQFTKTANRVGAPLDRPILAGAEFFLYPRGPVPGTWASTPIDTAISDSVTGVVTFPLPPNWYAELPDLQFKLREEAPFGFVQPQGYWIVTVNFCYVMQRVEFDFANSPGAALAPVFEYVPFVTIGGLMASFQGGLIEALVYPEYPAYSADLAFSPAGAYLIGEAYPVYPTDIPDMSDWAPGGLEAVIVPTCPDEAAAQFAHYEALGFLEQVEGGVIIHGPPEIGGGLIMPFNPVSDWTLLNAAVQNAPTNAIMDYTIWFDGSFTTTANNAIVIDDGRRIVLDSQGGVTHYWRQTTPGERHFIVTDGSSLTLRDIILRGDQENVAAYHGGIHVEDGSSLTMMNPDSVIENNRAESGGAVLVRDANSTFDMTGGIIQGNRATDSGAVFVSFEAVFTMSDDALIYDNRAQHHGAVSVSNDAVFHMNGGTIDYNHANLSAGGVGVLFSGRFYMTDGYIRRNTSVWWGGGVGLSMFGTFEMTDGVIELNTTEGQVAGGGGVRINDGMAVGPIGTRFTMIGGIIRDNTTFGPVMGGGVSGAGPFDMNGGTIAGNTALLNGGGVGMFGSGARFTMRAGTITGNHAGNSGGGIYASIGGSIFFSGPGTKEIRENTANQNGGGFMVGPASAGAFIGGDAAAGILPNAGPVIVTENTAHGGGGIALVAMQALTIDYRWTISDNTASIGGGVLLGFASTVQGTESGSLYMLGGTISNNTATHFGGGGVAMASTAIYSTFTMHDGAITGNMASADGGGIYIGRNDGTVVFTMYDGSITNNAAGRDGGGIFTARYQYGNPLIPGPGVYDNIQIYAAATFAGNRARIWFYPPEIPLGTPFNRLPNIQWNPASGSSVNSGGWLYLLNNFDINYAQGVGTWWLGNQPLAPFEFVKRDHLGAPLPGVIFHLYRYTTGAPNDGWGNPIHIVTTGPTGVVGPWLLTHDGLYRLREVYAPGNFQTPPGSWLLSVNQWGIIDIITPPGNPSFTGLPGNRELRNRLYPYPTAKLEFTKTIGVEGAPREREPLPGAIFWIYLWCDVADDWETTHYSTATSSNVLGSEGRVVLPLPVDWVEHLPDFEFKLREEAPSGFEQPQGYWIVTVNFCYIMQHVIFSFANSYAGDPIFENVPSLTGAISGFALGAHYFFAEGAYGAIEEITKFDWETFPGYWTGESRVAFLEAYGLLDIPADMDSEERYELYAYFGAKVEQTGTEIAPFGGGGIPIMPFSVVTLEPVTTVAELATRIGSIAAGTGNTYIIPIAFTGATYNSSTQAEIVITGDRHVILDSHTGANQVWNRNQDDGERHFRVVHGASLEIRNVTLSRSAAFAGLGYASGGVQVGIHGVPGSGAAFSMTHPNATISNNRAANGGGVQVFRQSVFTMTYGHIINNAASTGGGVFVDGAVLDERATFTMTGGRVSGNQATSHGGGVGVCCRAIINVSDEARIYNNIAGLRGGGVSLGTQYFTYLNLMPGGEIHHNLSSEDGGGVYAGMHGTTTITGGAIHNNTALRNGGGVHVEMLGFLGIFEMHGTVLMTGGAIRDNLAHQHGGGVFLDRKTAVSFTMEGGSIIDNTAVVDGGGIFTGNFLYLPTVAPGAGVYDNLKIYEDAIFAGNKARAWFIPPTINPPMTIPGQLDSIVWNPASGSSVNTAGGYIYLLNNYDINYLRPQDDWFLGNRQGIPFRFHKADQYIYNAGVLAVPGPGTMADTPGWLAGTLLPGAQFNFYRWEGSGAAPTFVTYVYDVGTSTYIPAAGWVRVNAAPETSSGNLNEPIEFLVTLNTTYHLVEIVAPTGFQLPYGQWRVTASVNAANDVVFTIVAAGATTIPAFVYLFAPCGDCSNPDCADGAPDDCDYAAYIHFLGNWPTLVLPLSGGVGQHMFLFAGALTIFLALGLLTIHHYKSARFTVRAAKTMGRIR